MARKKLIFTGTWLDVDVLVLNNLSHCQRAMCKGTSGRERLQNIILMTHKKHQNKMWTNEPKCNALATSPPLPPRIFSLFVFRNRLPIDRHHNVIPSTQLVDLKLWLIRENWALFLLKLFSSFLQDCLIDMFLLLLVWTFLCVSQIRIKELQTLQVQ